LGHYSGRTLAASELSAKAWEPEQYAHVVGRTDTFESSDRLAGFHFPADVLQDSSVAGVQHSRALTGVRQGTETSGYAVARKTKLIHTQLDSERIAAVSAEAKRRGISFDQHIREAVAEFIKKSNPRRGKVTPARK
jgi:hypothetical protein